MAKGMTERMAMLVADEVRKVEKRMRVQVTPFSFSPMTWCVKVWDRGELIALYDGSRLLPEPKDPGA